MAIFDVQKYGNVITPRSSIPGTSYDLTPPYLLVVVTADPFDSITTGVQANGVDLTPQPFVQPSVELGFTEFFQVWILENAPFETLTVSSSPIDKPMSLTVYADASFVSVETDEQEGGTEFDIDMTMIEGQPYYEIIFSTDAQHRIVYDTNFPPTLHEPLIGLPGDYSDGSHIYHAVGGAMLGPSSDDPAWWAFWNWPMSVYWALWYITWSDHGPAIWDTPFQVRDPSAPDDYPKFPYTSDVSTNWFGLRVLVGPPRFMFTPSPCGALYIETDLIQGLVEGDTTDPFPIPDFGTAGTNPWGGGDGPEAPFPQGFYYHETGAPGTNGPWIEQHNDHEYEDFPGAYHRQLIQNAFETEPFEYFDTIVDLSTPGEAHWTLFSVFKADEQPLVNSSDQDPEPFYDGKFPNRQWFGTDAEWGLGYYHRAGQWWMALHVGNDYSHFLELPVVLGEWHYLEARQDATHLYLRVNDTEISQELYATQAEEMRSDIGNTLQWGDHNHHMGWTLLQVCDATLHCPSRQARRWEIQDKYGFTRSPEEDCTDDPEEPPPITVVQLRRARMVQIIG